MSADRPHPDSASVPNSAPAAVPAPPSWPTLAEATRVWLRIALLSFGGPAGQIAVMHRLLVQERRWLGEGRFLHALNFCMLLPGPEAQQLATYIGWMLHGVRGGLIAGILFVLPGVAAILALSWIYALYGALPLVTALFFGLKAAVLAIVLQALLRIGRRALRNGPMLALAAAAFVAIFAFGAPFPAIVLAAALIGYAGGRVGLASFQGGGGHGADGGAPVADRDTVLGETRTATGTPSRGWSLRMAAILLTLWLGPVALLLLAFGPADVFSRVALFFSQMAVVTFGGAYAVLAWVAQAAVDQYGWLRPGEMLDGLGMAETTPGPLIMVTQFVGFMAAFREAGTLPPLLAGTLGGLLTTWVTFTPCFLWIFLGAPYVERLRAHRALAAALTAITAAVVGVILNLALWFGLHVVFAEVGRLTAFGLAMPWPTAASLNPWAALLVAAALVAAFGFRVGMVRLLVATALAGIGLGLAGAI